MAVANPLQSIGESAFDVTGGRDTLQEECCWLEGQDDFLPGVIEPTCSAEQRKTIDTPCHEMFIKVLYRGRPVATRRVVGRAGCRIFFGSLSGAANLTSTELERLFGQHHLLQLCLPQPTEALSRLQPLWCLLNCMTRGILLEVEDDIFATRLCHAVIFWGAPGNDGASCELQKGQRTKIFDYKSFLNIYNAFENPHRMFMAAEPPPYEVLLGVGQPWGPQQKRDNNLLMISVTHCHAEMMMAHLHRERWERKCYLDTDLMWISNMTEEDRKVREMRQELIKERCPSAQPVPRNPNEEHSP